MTEALAVLPDGADFVAVPVVAEEYGQSSNAAPGQICELVTPVEGVRGVPGGESGKHGQRCQQYHR